MKNSYRDYTCGELTLKNVGETVKLAGWVQRIRNLGSMQFIDLRDQFGITQIVISDKQPEVQEKGVSHRVCHICGRNGFRTC